MPPDQVIQEPALEAGRIDVTPALHIPPNSCRNPQPHCRSLGQSVLGCPPMSPLFQAGKKAVAFLSLLVLVWPGATVEQNREANG